MNMKYFFAAIAAVPLLVSVGAAAGEKGTFESAWAGTDIDPIIEPLIDEERRAVLDEVDAKLVERFRESWTTF